MLINRILSVLLSMVFLIDFFSCEKVDLETIEEKMEDQVFLNMRQNTKSINDIDTTLNVSSDGFVYFEPYVIKNCGCVPSVTVEIITGALVFKFPLASMYSCPLFHISFTANGYSEEANIFTTDGMYVTNKRVGYGQSCEGSVTLTCLNKEQNCKWFANNPCSRTVHFSLKEGSEGSTINPNSCDRNYGEVVIKVIEDGKLSVIVSQPSIVDNEMAPTQLDVKCGNQTVRSFDLEIGENTVYYNAGIYGYQIRIYNPDLCIGSGPTYHYLEGDLLGGPGLKHVREINNNH